MIDYLRITTGKSAKFDPKTWAEIYLSEFGDTFTGETCQGLMGYNQGRITESGGQLFWHDTEDVMGVCFQWSGYALNKLFVSGQDENSLVSALNAKNAKFKRIDYAFDVFENEQATPMAFFKHIQSEEVNTGARQNKLVHGKNPRKQKQNNADTVYLGSRQSDTFLRVYDKAKELKIDEFLWTRIEIEIKGRKAEQVGKMVNSDVKIKDLSSSLIKKMGNFQLDWFNEAIEGETYCYEGLPSKDAANPNQYFDDFLIKWLKKNGHKLTKDRMKQAIDLLEGMYWR